MITIQCDSTHPDAQRSEVYPDVFVRSFAHGCVIKTWERNGYDDSDFFATYWDKATGQAETIEYGTTRAWTYSNGAVVDATPEVLAAYRLSLIAAAVITLTDDDKVEAATPAAGKVCKVIKGRKIAIGSIVYVRRLEAPRRFSRYSGEVIEAAVALDSDRGNCSGWAHTNLDNLEVINPDQYRVSAIEIADNAARLVDSGVTVMSKACARALARLR